MKFQKSLTALFQSTFQVDHYPVNESPHGLRRHYDSPVEFDAQTGTYIPNGHLVGSADYSEYLPYDVYMQPNSTSNDPYHPSERHYEVVDEEEEEDLAAQDGVVYSEDGRVSKSILDWSPPNLGVYPSSVDQTSAEEYGTNASCTDLSLQHYQHHEREQTPDYDTAASFPTTSNYVFEEANRDVYDEYAQYDQETNERYDYASPDRFDVDMEDFGETSAGLVNTRQETPQGKAIYGSSSPHSSRSDSAGLRR